ncbi:hypothetical protein [Polaromonas sp.]|uniref:hypothetical protein n=1 Tax=Polaromonas sp. TaxID=1869339 RepID=UPI00326314BF
MRTISSQTGIRIAPAWHSALMLLLTAAILLTVCTPLRAKDVDIWVTYTSAPTIYVESNGARYTRLSSAKHGNQPIQFNAHLQIQGGQDRVRKWSVAPRLSALGKTWGWDWSVNSGTSRPPESDWGIVSKSYGHGDRPTNVDKFITMNVGRHYVESFAVDVCNAHAGTQRSQGKGNTAIFDSPYTLHIRTTSKYNITYTNIADTDSWQIFESEPDAEAYAKVVCMKWAGAQVPPATSDLQAGIGVTQSSLTIIETATVNGACKVNLSGVIETNVTNAQVKFRYEHTNGTKSDIKTVTTDHSKTAFFSYKYDVPNNPNGGEAGSIRIVGVSPKFESAWKTYDMECRNPAPQGLQAATVPKVSMNVEPGLTVMVDGQICPSAVLLHTTITAGSAFHGKGLFLGDHFLTAPEDIEVSVNQVKHVFGKRELSWNPTGGGIAGTLAAPPTGGKPPMKTQQIRIGFNLANLEGKVIAQAAQKMYSITCKEPKLNPGIPHSDKPLLNAPRNDSSKNLPLPVLQGPAVLKLPAVPSAPARSSPAPQNRGAQRAPTSSMPRTQPLRAL